MDERILRREELIYKIVGNIISERGYTMNVTEQFKFYYNEISLAISEIEDENVWQKVLEDGTIEYRNSIGELHSINDEPAIINTDGSKIWYCNDKIHRDNDLPAETWPDGTQVWYWNNQIHRDGDKPAFENEKVKQWYKNGKLHRDNNLPAIIYSDGKEEYYINGKQFSIIEEIK